MISAGAVCLLAFLAAEPPPDKAKLDKMIAQFAPVEISAKLDGLDAAERLALAKLVEAAKRIDGLFLAQVWAGNTSLLLDLLHDGSPLGRGRVDYFLLMKGPWDRVDHHKAFVPGVPEKPGQAAFYPEDASKADVESWGKTLSGAEKEKATGFFTVIRRGADQKLRAIPYREAYQNELIEIARLLDEAARATHQPTLKAFLEKRATAFLSDDYYASDVAWMELDASIEPTIGPYEVYEDEWFNQKAAYEAFIAIKDDVETKKLARFGAELQELENHLPIEPSLRNPKLGALAPIRVVNEIYASGDASHGVQTAAFNLPNDERVIKEKGSKRVMLKNVQEAKFNRVLVPIAKVALAPADQKKVSFDSFFTHILMHELMHGLGPHNLGAGAQATTVRQALKDAYSAIEESKADISGLWAMQQLVDKGVIDKSIEPTMYTTYLASAFRSIRFGVVEAHGKGTMLQINSLLDKGAFKVAKDGRFSVDASKVKEGVTALATELLMIEAKGDYASAKALLEKMAVMRPEVQAVLDKLKTVPIDIAPRFTTAVTLESATAQK